MKKLILRLITLAMLMPSATFAFAGSIEPKQDEKKLKWGYVDSSTNKWVVKPKYDSAEPLSEQPNGKMRAKVTSGGKTGFVDENGKVLNAGVVFEEIVPLQGDAMFVTVKGKKGVANYDGAYLIKPELTDTEALDDEGYFITKKDKTGFIKPDGSLLLDIIYEKIDPSVPEYFIVYKGGKAGITLRDGEMKLAPKDFTDARPFGQYWIVSKKDKAGLYDLKNDKLIIEPKYDEVAEPFVLDKEYFRVRDKEKWGVYSAAGEQVLKCKSIEIVPVPAYRAIYSQTGKTKGKLYYMPSMKNIPTMSITEKKIGPFSRTIIETKKGVIINLADKNGKNITNGNSVDVYDRFYVVKINSPQNNETKYDLYKKNGDLIKPDIKLPGTKFGDWTVFGRFAVSPDDEVSICKFFDEQEMLFVQKEVTGPWTLVDIEGDECGSFDMIGDIFDEDMIHVKNTGLWGLSDCDGIVIDCISDTPLKLLGDDVFIFTKGIYKGAATIDEEIIIPAEYLSINLEKGSSNILVAKKDNFKGRYDVNTNKWLDRLNGQFYELSDFSRYFSIPLGYVVYKDNKAGIVDKNGSILFPLEYDKITAYNDNVLALFKGNKPTYYNLNTLKEIHPNPTFEVVKSSAKSLDFGWTIDYDFCPNKTYKLKVQVINKRTKKVAHTIDKTFETTESGFGRFEGYWYVPLPRYVTYIAKCTLYDSNGKQVTLKNNRPIEFYLYSNGW